MEWYEPKSEYKADFIDFPFDFLLDLNIQFPFKTLIIFMGDCGPVAVSGNSYTSIPFFETKLSLIEQHKQDLELEYSKFKPLTKRVKGQLIFNSSNPDNDSCKVAICVLG